MSSSDEKFSFEAKHVTLTILGGGNLAHVMAGLAGSWCPAEQLTINILSRKADTIGATWMSNGVSVCSAVDAETGALQNVVKGWAPTLVTSDPSKVIPQSDVIIITAPSHARPGLLRDSVLPHISAEKERVFIGCMHGLGGFDYAARHEIVELQKSSNDSKRCENVRIWAVKDVPFMSQMIKVGEAARNIGPKKHLYLAFEPTGNAPVPASDDDRKYLSSFLEFLTHIPVVQVEQFMALTLTPGNPIMHPAIMYGRFGPESPHKGQPIPERVRFYEDCSELSADYLQRADDEIQAIVKHLVAKYNVDLTCVWPLFTNLQKVYGDQVADPSTLRSCMQTNSAYKAVFIPLRKVDGNDDESKNGWTVIPEHRVFTEDVPYGLVVLAGIADLCGIDTPMIHELLRWGQGILGKQYILPDGKLAGKDMSDSGLPLNYGIKNIEQMLSL
jgi:NAD/NADP octopine/nopaline dehydrogenase, alpha-helical domain